jgi:hypothetical protein
LSGEAAHTPRFGLGKNLNATKLDFACSLVKGMEIFIGRSRRFSVTMAASF